jgi:hypothetical protein
VVACLLPFCDTCSSPSCGCVAQEDGSVARKFAAWQVLHGSAVCFALQIDAAVMLCMVLGQHSFSVVPAVA